MTLFENYSHIIFVYISIAIAITMSCKALQPWMHTGRYSTSTSSQSNGRYSFLLVDQVKIKYVFGLFIQKKNKEQFVSLLLDTICQLSLRRCPIICVRFVQRSCSSLYLYQLLVLVLVLYRIPYRYCHCTNTNTVVIQ